MKAPDRRTRAQARRGRAVIRKTQLQRVEEDLGEVRGAEAISLVTALTREGWSLSGRREPEYSRAQTPYRFVPGRLT